MRNFSMMLCPLICCYRKIVRNGLETYNFFWWHSSARSTHKQPQITLLNSLCTHMIKQTELYWFYNRLQTFFIILHLKSTNNFPEVWIISDNCPFNSSFYNMQINVSKTSTDFVAKCSVSNQHLNRSLASDINRLQFFLLSVNSKHKYTKWQKKGYSCSF